MSNLYDHLRHMRGETSNALIAEFTMLLDRAIGENKTLLSVQVPSDMVARGLTVLIQTHSNPRAWIFLARKEIPGYIPTASYGLLHGIGWQVSGDAYGSEFASAFKSLSGEDTMGWASEIVAGLEALGTPQKRDWDLIHESR
jgi:hypothetical protein